MLQGMLLDLPPKIRLSLEKLARNKHSSLLGKFVKYGLKKAYDIGP
jgi:hypothetical protein